MEYDALAREAGCLESALPDVRARLLAHFQDASPSPETVQQWLEQTLREHAPHLFPPTPTAPWARLGIERTVWDSLSPTTRVDLARQHHPPPQVTTPHARRPITRTLTAAELAALDATGLTGAARTERARQWQQTPAPAQD
jgi:hypothetical protein